MALASLLLALQGGNVASLVADLDRDEVEVRRTAFTGLVRVGKPALPALHEAVRAGPSLDVRDASRRIIDAILARVREDFILEHAGKSDNHFCDGPFFDTRSRSANRLRDLAAWFPSCELIVANYLCMHRAPLCSGTWVSGLSRENGEIFTIWKETDRRVDLDAGDPEILTRYLRPVRDAADADALARLLAGP